MGRRSRKRPYHPPRAASDGRSRRRLRSLVGAAVLLAVAVTSAVLLLVYLPFSGGSDTRPRAIIIDQLAATDPNSAFVLNATGLLAAGGYAVDYVPPEEVTVDLYRGLPARGHEIVILRTHAASSGRSLPGGDHGLPAEPWAEVERGVSIFTNEPFDLERHATDHGAGRLARNLYFEGGGAFFGIIPEFVAEAMKGTFPGSTVILMGCDGLQSTVMADAFAARGAGDFVSWSDLVTADHTDKVTEQFLRHLLLDGHSTVEAVALTMSDLGADPFYGGLLMVRPAR